MEMEEMEKTNEDERFQILRSLADEADDINEKGFGIEYKVRREERHGQIVYSIFFRIRSVEVGGWRDLFVRKSAAEVEERLRKIVLTKGLDSVQRKELFQIYNDVDLAPFSKNGLGQDAKPSREEITKAWKDGRLLAELERITITSPDPSGAYIIRWKW